ncbi:MAG: hypothetical protein CMB79_18520 [Filomicrobium sp.]|nr:hypothetical protein [Filomicrobium sp.]
MRENRKTSSDLKIGTFDYTVAMRTGRRHQARFIGQGIKSAFVALAGAFKTVLFQSATAASR